MPRKRISHAGTAAALVYVGFALAAWLHHPSRFRPAENWLSDLGNPLANPGGAAFYNGGCILAALLLIGFYLDLGRWRREDRAGRVLLLVGQVAGVFSSIALILAAVFDIGRHFSRHAFFSMLIYLGLTWFLSFANTAFLRHPGFRRWVAVYGLLGAAVTFVFGVFLKEAYLGEWVTIGAFVTYVLLAENVGRASRQA